MVAVAVVLAVLAVLAGVAWLRGPGSSEPSEGGGRSGHGSREAGRGAVPVGTAVRDGGMRFTVSDFRCGTAGLGDEAPGDGPATADGDKVCVAHLMVTNRRDTGRALPIDRQTLTGVRGERRAAQVDAGSRDALSRTIAAHQQVSGVLSFDLPAGFVPRRLELHGARGSPGATVVVG